MPCFNPSRCGKYHEMKGFCLTFISFPCLTVSPSLEDNAPFLLLPPLVPQARSKAIRGLLTVARES